MKYIRKAEEKDISRIAEILVFNKRINYRSIFKNDMFSFGELQVLKVADEYFNDKDLMDRTWVYDDGFVKGIIEICGKEVNTFYVDDFFQSCGIGAELLKFAVKEHGCDFLWTLEKNIRAIAFYERNGFHLSGERKLGKGTEEYLVKMVI
ncbi:MAG: GNAT family N-acetyltransferase [Oscillospiraceae bacterium]|nr:GNAT family N-acetyltransferase [Oscillospiraceae bacterium]